MDEPEWLPVFLQSIENQHYRNFSVEVCVNQPDAWWKDPSRSAICQNNAESLSLLNSVSGFPLEVIDRSSSGSGWTGKRHGVGWARKTVMDQISRKAEPADIILSLDADTLFSENYFESVAETVANFPDATALTVPYYHRLPEDQEAARAILRYEIYMRYYFLNLWRIRSPYAFTALGSAMAIPVWAYRKVGGMTPKLSGEDFYFLQKLRKSGKLICWNSEKVFPAARFSSRVFFGTGPAMIRGAEGNWDSYPIYATSLFDEIGESCIHFPEMYKRTVETRVTSFLRELTGEQDPFDSLRTNSREVHQFVRACHEKFDGLRILQYLKKRHQEERDNDEELSTNDSYGTDGERLLEWLRFFFPSDTRYAKDEGRKTKDEGRKKLSFSLSSLNVLDQIRNFLAREEDRIRRENPLF